MCRFRGTQRLTRHVAAAAFGLLLVAACADPPSAALSPPTQVGGNGSVVQSPIPFTLQDAYRDLASRLGEFTGVSLQDGDVVVSAASDAVSLETFLEVRRWLRASGRPDLAVKLMRHRRVPYNYRTLDSLLGRLLPRIASGNGVNAVGIDEVAGRILIHVDDALGLSAVESSLLPLELPENSVAIQITGRITDVQGLQGQHSMLRGGVQINRQPLLPEHFGACSIGFVGWFTDSLQPSQPDLNRRVLTTASHCTTDQKKVRSDLFGQPYMPRVAAVEIDEAPVYKGPFAPCSQGMAYCRFADVAVLRVVDSIGSGGGSAAVSQPTVDPNNPPFLGVQAYTGSSVIGAIVGEHVIKVGRTTGQTGPGPIDLSCMNTMSGDIHNLCQQHAVVTVDFGDSGAPVFIAAGSPFVPNPRPAGVVIQGTTNSMWFSPAGAVVGTLGWKYFLVW